MKNLFLIRHAKSSWADPSLDDHERPLNGRGKRDAPRMAEWLRSQGARPDVLLSSTAQRAQRTARYFAKTYGIDKSAILRRAAIYEAAPDALLRLIHELKDEWDTVFLFGHNPGFTSLANLFPGEHIDNVPTCGIVRLEADVEHWTDFGPTTARQRAFYYPKMLE
jgi:phosphohistidine phosphatase